MKNIGLDKNLTYRFADFFPDRKVRVCGENIIETTDEMRLRFVKVMTPSNRSLPQWAMKLQTEIKAHDCHELQRSFKRAHRPPLSNLGNQANSPSNQRGVLAREE